MANFRVPSNYIDHMSKGYVIPKDEVDNIFDNKRYNHLDVTNFVNQLNKMAKKSGRSWVFRSRWVDRGEVLLHVHILTDAEASEYTKSLSSGTMRKMKRTLHVSQSVDVHELTDQQKRQHMITENMVGRRLQAMREITRRTVSDPVIHQNMGINPLRRS